MIDRTLGKSVVRGLRDAGWDVVALAEVFDNDAQGTSDEQWITWASQEGLAGITCDKRIRHQPAFRLATRPIFALSRNQLLISEQLRRLVKYQERIFEASRVGGNEFWVVYEDRMQRRFP